MIHSASSDVSFILKSCNVKNAYGWTDGRTTCVKIVSLPVGTVVGLVDQYFPEPTPVCRFQNTVSCA